ncbi:phasin family protein [Ferruginivarius sediminum]|uniref:Phasin family protein n=1 Tax=Ferruginivarius sediminum TaxID=2661937 RepID=A0A369TBV9_9PROT|nr:phasin family protein [Ferruginivarius sediminum]RDD62831.1 phasin family protein [Ferruginivarius sediminum]
MTTAQKKTTQSQDVLKPVEDAVTAGKEQFENVVKVGNDAATKQYEQAANLAKEQIEKGSSAMFKGYGEATMLNKANIDAVVKASTIATKGFESLSRELVDFTQKQIETNVETTKKLFGAKTLQEFFDLQADFARQNFDRLLAESAKVTEMSVKVTNDALQPIQAQTNAAAEKVMKPAA